MTRQTSTIGLVTLDEMKARQEKVVQEREQELAKQQLQAERERQKAIDAKQAKKDRQKKQVGTFPQAENPRTAAGWLTMIGSV